MFTEGSIHKQKWKLKNFEMTTAEESTMVELYVCLFKYFLLLHITIHKTWKPYCFSVV